MRSSWSMICPPRHGQESRVAANVGSFEFQRVDIRDARALESVVKTHAKADVVLHLAAQVAVTTSVTEPRHDFEVNALGTFNVLEACENTPKTPS